MCSLSPPLDPALAAPLASPQAPEKHSRHGAPQSGVQHRWQDGWPPDLEDREHADGSGSREPSWELLHWRCLCDSLHGQTEEQLLLPPPLLAG